jgi:predicted RND superfamily exporter protein
MEGMRNCSPKNCTAWKTSEGPWIVCVAFLCVFFLVFISDRSFYRTIWTLVPLVFGLGLTLGLMAVLGLRLNFYNVVVLPALLGMGVDDGVHFFRRWRENERDSILTLKELFGPLTVTTITTMLGYAGLTLAHHPGLQSIGFLACLGLSCTWATTLFLFPGLLNIAYRRQKRSIQEQKNFRETGIES